MIFLKKAKLGGIFGTLGLLFLLVFIILLFLHYFYSLKTETALESFNKNSTYELVFYPTKNEQKRKLFDYKNYHFYGYGIRNIEVSYNGVSMNLETILKKEYLSLEELLENRRILLDSEKIKEYQMDAYKIIISNLYKEEKDVLVIKIEKESR